MLFPILRPSSLLYLLWSSSLTKDMQTEQLLCWSGMTDTEDTTSGSNEEDLDALYTLIFVFHLIILFHLH